MAVDPDTLRPKLRAAGLSERVINAAWPSWWSDELFNDPSGRAELRFALARRLGLSPRSLTGERVEFVWTDEAMFKNLSVANEAGRAALSSFGFNIGRLLIRATPEGGSIKGVDALALRQAVLAGSRFVDLNALLATCWALGIPVVYLRLFPLAAKSMHAMIVNIEGRQAILLGRDASYPASVAFTLAHEMGHAALRHVADAPALIDMEDPAIANDPDDQENEADRFALALLTGREEPTVETSRTNFNAPTLATAVFRAADHYQIEPGTLALCIAHQHKVWPIAQAALRRIYSNPREVWRDVNGIADQQLDWAALGEDGVDWIRQVMGSHD